MKLQNKLEVELLMFHQKKADSHVHKLARALQLVRSQSASVSSVSLGLIPALPRAHLQSVLCSLHGLKARPCRAQDAVGEVPEEGQHTRLVGQRLAHRELVKLEPLQRLHSTAACQAPFERNLACHSRQVWHSQEKASTRAWLASVWRSSACIVHWLRLWPALSREVQSVEKN